MSENDTHDERTDSITMKLATDKHGMVSCGCANPSPVWSPAEEADESGDWSTDDLAALPGIPIWVYWERSERDHKARWNDRSDLHGCTWDEHIEDTQEKADEYGLSPHCSNCHGTMDPVQGTYELMDRAGTDQ